MFGFENISYWLMAFLFTALVMDLFLQGYGYGLGFVRNSKDSKKELLHAMKNVCVQ